MLDGKIVLYAELVVGVYWATHLEYQRVEAEVPAEVEYVEGLRSFSFVKVAETANGYQGPQIILERGQLEYQVGKFCLLEDMEKANIDGANEIAIYNVKNAGSKGMVLRTSGPSDIAHKDSIVVDVEELKSKVNDTQRVRA